LYMVIDSASNALLAGVKSGETHTTLRFTPGSTTAYLKVTFTPPPSVPASSRAFSVNSGVALNRTYIPATITRTVCETDEDEYRFGFNGMYKDNEVAGVGNSIDYKARQLDTRTGRFWSVDPLFKDYPWNSTYAFAENDVIRCIDLEGLEKVDVVTTSFAPFSLFGSDGFGAFTGDGAGRKFGLERNKYRTSGSVKLDLANSKYISKWAATDVTSTYHRYSKLIMGDYTAKSPSRTKVNGLNLQSNFVGTNFSVAGSNKAHMSAPDIDVNVAIGFQRINDNKYRVSGSVRGDRFPANETYLRDEGGNILMLGVSGVNTENENLGPYIDLPGDNRRFMSSFNFNVIFEGENNSTIKGVETSNGNFIDRETWNQQFQQLDPKSSQTGTNSK
jgi:RHS repeat-associated protein